MNVLISLLVLPSGEELINVPAIEVDLVAMGFTKASAKEHCNKALENYKWEKIRTKRDKLLASTDFAEYSRKLSSDKKNEYLSYRDELFNIPQDFSSADDVTWPNKPD